jgi:hypothetical protein
VVRALAWAISIPADDEVAGVRIRTGVLFPTLAIVVAGLCGAAPAVAAPGVAAPVVAAPAVAAPAVAVSASGGLRGGQAITVTARHLPAATEVWLQQCPREPVTGSDEEFCTNRVPVTTTATGTLRVRWTLLDPVWFRYPFGDPEPQYCRADSCRMWVTLPDGTSVPSVPLRFTGSPATITATPSAGLVDGSRVRVTGAAPGSAGKYVRLTQQSCVHIIQGWGCDAGYDLGLVKLTGQDTFARTVTVHRFEPSGEDCATPWADPCGITVTVLDAYGEPDDSFGVGRLGQPSAYLTFTP